MPKKSVRGGIVYAFEEIDRPFTKIGLSWTDVHHRFSQISAEHPWPLRIAALVEVTENVYAIERQLHAMYRGCRKRGEWFEMRCTQEDMQNLVDFFQDQQRMLHFDHAACVKRVKQARQMKRFDHQYLALLAAVRFQDVLALERGKRFQSLGVLIRIARALDCSLDWLVWGIGDPWTDGKSMRETLQAKEWWRKIVHKIAHFLLDL